MNVYFVDVRHLNVNELQQIYEVLNRVAYTLDIEIDASCKVRSYRISCSVDLTKVEFPLQCPIVDVSQYDLNKLTSIDQLQTL